MALKFNAVSGNLDLVLDKALEIKFNNITSGLTATQVQAAIDEIVALINGLPDPITYKGTWNATTNTPTLSNSNIGVSGFLYQVNVAGTVNFGAGNISFEVGDKVVNNGSTWDKWDMTDAVSSVNGFVGAVVLSTTDIAEGTNLYFTDERAQDAAGALATSSAKVSLTYNDASNTLTPDIVAGSLVNADVNASAAIAYSKLNLTSSIVNVDIAAAAAIALTKLAATTANRAIISDASGFLVPSSTTASEIGFVAGTTSNIQAQINAKTGYIVVSISGATALVAGTTYIATMGSAYTVTLPAPALNVFLTIKVNGSAFANNLTVLPNAAETIDGAASLIMNSAWQSTTLVSNGTNWFIL